MPRLEYTPLGSGKTQGWDIDFGRLMSPERVLIEKLTGMTWLELQKAYWGRSTAAVHAVLYVLLKRQMPTLKPSEVEFCEDEIQHDLTLDEARQIQTRIATALAGQDMTVEEREHAEAQLADLARNLGDHAVQGEDGADPKAAEPSED